MQNELVRDPLALKELKFVELLTAEVLYDGISIYAFEVKSLFEESCGIFLLLPFLILLSLLLQWIV